MNKQIFRLAIPNILSNLSVPLLGIVDIALVGRLSEAHIGAVGLGGIIFSFLYWNFGFLRIGTTGITAQAYGAKNLLLSRLTLLRSLSLGLGIALILLMLHPLILSVGQYLLNTPLESRELVNTYFNIRIWDAIAVLAIFSFNGWYFGRQNTWLPMIVTIVVNVGNILLSWYFVHFLEMDIRGVAYGTLIAQYIGVFVYIGIVLWSHGKTFLMVKFQYILEPTEIKRFIKINADFFFRNISLTVAFGYFYRQSAAMGATILAVNTVLLQYVNFMSYGVDGFAHAAESLVGKYKGAKNPSKLEKAIQLCLVWGGLTAAVYSGVYWFGGVHLLAIFTDDIALISEASKFLIWMIPLPFVGFVCYLWDGVFGGLTASTEMRNTMLLALLMFIAGASFLMNYWGNHGLWFGFALFLGVRGLSLSYIYFKKKKEYLN
jgi:multidrug resistance protein, MATE family